MDSFITDLRGIPAHGPRQNCKFSDHGDMYYEGEAGQYLHLEFYKNSSKKRSILQNSSLFYLHIRQISRDSRLT